MQANYSAKKPNEFFFLLPSHSHFHNDKTFKIVTKVNWKAMTLNFDY